MLGYDVDPRGGRLVINEAEAKLVREIFDLYRQHRSVASVLEELHRRKWITKSWIKKDGSQRQGSAFTKNKLVRLLTNAIYVGKVEHKGALVAGEQKAIVASDVWQAVNDDLRSVRRGANGMIRTPQNALLKGVLFCGSCTQPMVPTYTAKGDRRYRLSSRAAAPPESLSGEVHCRSADRRIGGGAGALGTGGRRGEGKAERDRYGLARVPRERIGEFLRRIVRRVVYNGASGTVSLELGHED